MKNLTITNPNFITYKDELLTIDILGGVDLEQVERLICTLRIAYEEYSPSRSTIDLYNDHQNDKLIRTICDKYELQLLEVSKSIQKLVLQLEEYRLCVSPPFFHQFVKLKNYALLLVLNSRGVQSPKLECG